MNAYYTLFVAIDKQQCNKSGQNSENDSYSTNSP